MKHRHRWNRCQTTFLMPLEADGFTDILMGPNGHEQLVARQILTESTIGSSRIHRHLRKPNRIS